MRSTTVSRLLAALLPLVSPQGVSAAVTCTNKFTVVTAANAIKALHPGWNLGNTLDAVPDEGSWNNAPATPALLSQIKARGFKSIRIPVTWAYHFDTASPSWTVNPTFMTRVETVVDQALAAGFNVVLNVHHDSWVWADQTVAGANTTMILEKFTSLWSQIGTKFACKSSSLIFEAINEPTGSTQAHGDLLNKMNANFLDVINKAGGFNPQRVVSLSGLGQDILKTTQFFKRPTTYPNQPWAIQFHYYSPYDFIFSAWGKTIWGSDADKATLEADFDMLHGNFSGVPAFIGEWDASVSSTEVAARWKYNDFFIKTTNKYGYSAIIWDNGDDQYNRTAAFWKDPVGIDVLFNAAAGKANALADSTTDINAASQNTSAYLWHKVGAAVTDVEVPYILNGNKLSGVKDSKGKTLSSSDYTMSSAGVLKLSKSYLSTLYSATTKPGAIATLTLSFSASPNLTLQVYQFATPILPSSSSTYSLNSLNAAVDLHIPITYQGLPKVAAIRALREDGSILVDDWTQYLGPLQKGRMTYGDWGFDDKGLTVWAAGVAKLKASGGQGVRVLVEFWPRWEGNSVEVRFTV
ncbi:hypothetical protein HYFRA_00001760 [Hymenoscyphus fraxineus]|uniref:Glycoside hydrolase family 5 protein n=1 Tax=Hymenoscyphus fraxineus TaxID=746836 RepID=A0A9N9KKM5_9HELO|nr:hypothetical protein HYFRA_00001760 [Hymenoscyphus fraxineus]